MLCLLYWSEELTTACSTGRAQISFHLNQISNSGILDTVM